MLYHIVLVHIISYYIISNYIILFYIILYYNILYHTIVYHIISYHIISYHIILYYIYYVILYYIIYEFMRWNFETFGIPWSTIPDSNGFKSLGHRFGPRNPPFESANPMQTYQKARFIFLPGPDVAAATTFSLPSGRCWPPNKKNKKQSASLFLRSKTEDVDDLTIATLFQLGVLKSSFAPLQGQLTIFVPGTCCENVTLPGETWNW